MQIHFLVHKINFFFYIKYMDFCTDLQVVV